MKRDIEKLNLLDAFSPIPDDCRDALMNAARSVKEEEKMKRATLRTVLIAALIIIATTAVALASGKVFGWIDFFQTENGTLVPKAAQEIMQSTEKQEGHTLDAAVFTPHELYADKNIVMTAVKVQLAEGEKGLLCGGDPFDPIGANGENGKAAAARLGVDPMSTWADAAKQLGLPLYSANAMVEAPAEYATGELMGDPMFNEDGSVTCFSVQPLNGKADGEKIDCDIFLELSRINPDDMEDRASSQDRMQVSVPLSAPIETITYDLKEEYVSYGMRLDGVRGELTPAGLYLYADFTAQDDMTVEQYNEKGQVLPMWFDENGNRYSFGMNGSYFVDTDEWPLLRTMGMISVDGIPDTLILALEDDNLGGGAPAPHITLHK